MNVLASNARIPSTARIMLNVHTTPGPKIMSTEGGGELEFCPILSPNQVRFVGEHVSVVPVAGGLVLKSCSTVSSTRVRFEVTVSITQVKFEGTVSSTQVKFEVIATFFLPFLVSLPTASLC